MQKLSLLYNRLLLTASTDRKYTNTPFGFKWWDELKLLFRSFRSSSGKAHIFNRFIFIFSLWITLLNFYFNLKIFHLFVVEKSLSNQCCIFEKRLFECLSMNWKREICFNGSLSMGCSYSSPNSRKLNVNFLGFWREWIKQYADSKVQNQSELSPGPFAGEHPIRHGNFCSTDRLIGEEQYLISCRRWKFKFHEVSDRI